MRAVAKGVLRSRVAVSVAVVALLASGTVLSTPARSSSGGSASSPRPNRPATTLAAQRIQLGSEPFTATHPTHFGKHSVHLNQQGTSIHITSPATGSTTPASTPAPIVAVPSPAPVSNAPCLIAKCIALTFDDGPGIYTQTLLTELAAAGVHATFFVVGRNVVTYPDAVKAEIAAGDEVGNHSWDHPDLTKLSQPDAVAEIARNNNAIQQAAGVTPTLLRPPYGAINGNVSTTLAQFGMSAVLWDVDTQDWLNRNSVLTTRRALAGAHPGAIVLMHDIHPTTVTAIPGIIAALKAQGYTFVTVSQLLGQPLQPGRSYFALGNSRMITGTSVSSGSSGG